MHSDSRQQWAPRFAQKPYVICFPQVLTKALQLHPTASGLWSYAAAWEFEHNSNAAAARNLMQRGLRMCKTSQQLWLEYFRMELMYAHKLAARRRVLGIDTTGLPQLTTSCCASRTIHSCSYQMHSVLHNAWRQT